MTALRINSSNSMIPDASEAMMSYAAFWKSSTIDLPLLLIGASLRFIGHRLEAQADHLAALTRCRNVSEALESQAVFARTTISDYAAETDTILKEARSVVALPRAA